MKRKVGLMLIAVLTFVGFTIAANNAQAAVQCASMKITLVSGDAVSGSGIWLRNDTGAACGAIAAGASQFFVMNPAEADKLLAIALTAVSLQKNVWVEVAGDTVGSLLNIMAIDNQ